MGGGPKWGAPTSPYDKSRDANWVFIKGGVQSEGGAVDGGSVL